MNYEHAGNMVNNVDLPLIIIAFHTASNTEDILLNMSTEKKPFIVLVRELWIFHQIPGVFFSQNRPFRVAGSYWEAWIRY